MAKPPVRDCVDEWLAAEKELHRALIAAGKAKARLDRRIPDDYLQIGETVFVKRDTKIFSTRGGHVLAVRKPSKKENST